MTRHPNASPLETTIAGWLADLNLTTIGGNVPLPDVKERIAVLTVALAREFPDPALFSKASLLAIARQNRFFPGFADLSVQLTAWWEAHRPRAFVMPAALDQASLTVEERASVAAWLKHEVANDLPRHEMVMRLAVIRRHAPDGYRYLIQNNLLAADITVRQRWHEEPERRRVPPSPVEKEAVATMAAETVRHLHGTPRASGSQDSRRLPEPPRPSRPMATLTDQQLLAMHDPHSVRAHMLRAKIGPRAVHAFDDEEDTPDDQDRN